MSERKHIYKTYTILRISSTTID